MYASINKIIMNKQYNCVLGIEAYDKYLYTYL